MSFSAHKNSTTDAEHVVAPLLEHPKWNGEYIVMLKKMTEHPHITRERVEAHKRWITSVIDEQDERKDYNLEFPKYDSLMYSGRFSDSILDQIRRSDEVECVLKNGFVKLC